MSKYDNRLMWTLERRVFAEEPGAPAWGSVGQVIDFGVSKGVVTPAERDLARATADPRKWHYAGD